MKKVFTFLLCLKAMLLAQEKTSTAVLQGRVANAGSFRKSRLRIVYKNAQTWTSSGGAWI